MTHRVYREGVSYMGVLHDGHNEAYGRIVEDCIQRLGAGLKLSWVYGYDPEDYDSPEEIAEAIAEEPWYLKSLRCEGEPRDLLVFMDDEVHANLRGASEEWIILVNGILRALDSYNAAAFYGEEMLDRLNEGR